MRDGAVISSAGSNVARESQEEEERRREAEKKRRERERVEENRWSELIYVSTARRSFK